MPSHVLQRQTQCQEPRTKLPTATTRAYERNGCAQKNDPVGDFEKTTQAWNIRPEQRAGRGKAPQADRDGGEGPEKILSPRVNKDRTR